MLIYLLPLVQLSLRSAHVDGAFSCSNYKQSVLVEQIRPHSGRFTRNRNHIDVDLVAKANPSQLETRPVRKRHRTALLMSSSTSGEERIRIELETLTRIAVPSIGLASICFATFQPVASTLATMIHDAYDGGSAPNYYGAEALNLILQDNSNQFIQNMHNFFALVFSLLTGYTFAFVYRQQENVYYALYEEVSAAKSLLEQIGLATEGRTALYKTLLESMQTYVRYDMQMLFAPATNTTQPHPYDFSSTEANPEDIPALLLSTRPSKDPLETILYSTSVGTPSNMYSTVRQLRLARSKRLAAMQRKMPELNLYLLYILGFMAWITFPIVAAGSFTVGGDALLHVQRVQLSMGVFAMGGVLGIINELKVPKLYVASGNAVSKLLASSAYDVDSSVLETLIEGLDDEIGLRMAKCRENDDYTQDISYSNNASNFLESMAVRDDGTSVDKDVTLSNDIRVADNAHEKIRRRPKLFRRILNRIRRRHD